MPQDSVRYVKNGAGGRWWQAAKANGQIHAGWSNIPRDLLLNPDFVLIKKMIEDEFGHRRGSTHDFNALRWLLEVPSPSMVTAKPAMRGRLKTGHVKWPKTGVVLPCRSEFGKAGFGRAVTC